jgi:shikimate dehydrogenase
VSGSAWRLGLLGHPVAHSLSPALHAAAFEVTGQTGTYELIDCPPARLADAVARLRRGQFDGLNATIPHKEALVGLVDRLARSAAAVGAINTLVRTADGEVEGHNTDVEGLVSALEARWPDTPWRWHPVTVVGAGGAARAAVMAAVQLGASEVRVTNRTPDRATTLVADLRPACDSPLVAHPVETAFTGTALVLQATSAGMGWSPEQPRWSALRARATERLATARPDAVVMDLVYRPSPTPWVEAARAAGHEAEDGLAMLVGQAAAAFACWTGVRPPIEPMRLAALGALAE